MSFSVNDPILIVSPDWYGKTFITQLSNDGAILANGIKVYAGAGAELKSNASMKLKSRFFVWDEDYQILVDRYLRK